MLGIVRTPKSCVRAALGGILKALTTDPGCVLEIPSWARVAGNEVLKINREGQELTFYIKRAV